MSKREDEQSIVILMPRKVHRKFKVKVAREATSMTAVLNNLAERYVGKKLSLE